MDKAMFLSIGIYLSLVAIIVYLTIIRVFNINDNKSEITKIKPCPICGYRAKLIITYDREQIICTHCKARTEIEIGDYYDEGFMNGSYAISKWNKGDINNTSKILKEEKE